VTVSDKHSSLPHCGRKKGRDRGHLLTQYSNYTLQMFY
jgi:hypothetical protein